MNPGVLSLILILIALILLASGWGPVLLNGIATQGAVCFCFAWCLVARLAVPLPDGRTVGGTAVLVAVWAALVWIRSKSLVAAFHGAALGLFLGAIHFLMTMLAEVASLQWPYRSWAGTACILALAAALLIRRPEEQIATISLGLWIGFALYGSMQEEQSRVLIGGLRFQDQWWLTVLAARLVTGAGETANALVRSVSRGRIERRNTRK